MRYTHTHTEISGGVRSPKKDLSRVSLTTDEGISLKSNELEVSSL